MRRYNLNRFALTKGESAPKNCVLFSRILFLLIFFNFCPALSKDNFVIVPEVILVDSGVESGLPIEISPGIHIPDTALLIIRGIPSTTSLTEGRLFPSGTWVIKPSAMNEVRLLTGSGTIETVDLEISLATIEGDLLSTAATRLVVAPNVTALQPPEAAIATSTIIPETKDQNDVRKVQRVFTAIEREKFIKIMDRADRYLDEGKIGFARRFYQLAAEMGFAEGAEAIARTYDSEYLRRFPIMGGIEADEAKVQQWRQKAGEITENTISVIAK
jgi:hypothetical protein